MTAPMVVRAGADVAATGDRGDAGETSRGRGPQLAHEAEPAAGPRLTPAACDERVPTIASGKDLRRMTPPQQEQCESNQGGCCRARNQSAEDEHGDGAHATERARALAHHRLQGTHRHRRRLLLTLRSHLWHPGHAAQHGERHGSKGGTDGSRHFDVPPWIDDERVHSILGSVGSALFIRLLLRQRAGSAPRRRTQAACRVGIPRPTTLRRRRNPSDAPHDSAPVPKRLRTLVENGTVRRTEACARA
jgi:hypothetical protein